SVPSLRPMAAVAGGLSPDGSPVVCVTLPVGDGDTEGGISCGSAIRTQRDSYIARRMFGATPDLSRISPRRGARPLWVKPDGQAATTSVAAGSNLSCQNFAAGCAMGQEALPET